MPSKRWGQFLYAKAARKQSVVREAFSRGSFKLSPNQNQPRNLRVKCSDFRCAFSGRERDLPIVAVDEPIYRRLPCFIIATVDKFAALPWLGRVGAFFGKVERFDQDGFYGP